MHSATKYFSTVSDKVQRNHYFHITLSVNTMPPVMNALQNFLQHFKITKKTITTNDLLYRTKFPCPCEFCSVK